MKNAGKACNNRLYRHIRTFEKIVKNYFVIYPTFYRKINFHARIPYLRSEHDIMKGIIETVDTLTKDEVGAYLTNKLGTVYIDAFA